MKTRRQWTIQVTFKSECDPIHVSKVKKEIKELEELLKGRSDDKDDILIHSGEFKILKDEVIKINNNDNNKG